MGFVGCIPRFLKAHAGWILTGLSAAGVVGTAVLVAKEAPEARDAMEEEVLSRMKTAVDERYPDHETILTYEEMGEIEEEVQLTLMEKAEIVLPIYLPAILVGAATIGCMFGAQILNVRQQAAMMAAYGTLMAQFDQYRAAIRSEYGEEADKKAYLFSQQEVKRLKNEIREMKKENGPFLYEFASLPGVIFEAKPSQVFNALLHFNRNLVMRGYNTMEELYRFMGIPETCYNKSQAELYGWQEYENEVGWGIAFTDFNFLEYENSKGYTVNIIYSVIPPYELDVDYGFEGEVSNRIYTEYNLELAKAYAEEYGGRKCMADIVKVDKDHICSAMTIL